jgi:IS30 family transposase
MGQITEAQRYTISQLKKAGEKQTRIAQIIGKDKSVVSRELRRNCDKRSGEYRAELAQQKCTKRHKEKRKKVKFDSAMQKLVKDLIEEDYSPEQVVGYLSKQGISIVSVERIYQYVWADKKEGGTLHTHLRRQGRKYRKRGNKKDTRGRIKGRIGIEKRSPIVAKRERFGDLEVDLIIGKNHNQAILTINDRAAGVLKMRKVKSKESEIVSRAIIEELEEWIPYIHTITADNGKEFAGHKEVAEALCIDYYFARPYHSWERGSNENLNGLVRQYFPKGCDFTKITDQDIKEVELKLNNRPRKRYKYENPIFVMEKLLFTEKVAFVT